HAKGHHIRQLFGVAAVAVERRARVGAHGNAPTGAVVHLERFAVALLDGPRLVHHVGGNAPVGVVENVAQRGDGRHQESLPGEHFVQALLVHENAVLDRIDARAHGIQNAFGALRVAGRAFAEALGLVHAGVHLVVAVVRVHGVDAGRHDAAGGHDFHQVAARMHLFAHCLDDFVATIGHAAGAVAVAAGHADHAAGRLDGGPGEHAARNGVAHAEFQ